jgi:SAM-dependent methyltransferase
VPQDLAAALAELRPLLLDADRLVRAVAAGRRRGQELPWRRAELRPVDLKDGRRLQVVRYDGSRAPHTCNARYDGEAGAAVDELLALPFGNWHVQTTEQTVQLRVTKKGEAQLHRAAAPPPGGPAGDGAADGEGPAAAARRHDRVRQHLIEPGDPLFTALGATADKRRQVDAFVRVLASVVEQAPLPTDRPLQVVDLGCGNAYLTFAAYRFLSATRPVQLVGVDVREPARDRNTRLAADLGWQDGLRFVAGTIRDAPVGGADVVLALHACDTATDDALAQAVRWSAAAVLAAPCCHHDLQRQLSANAAPPPYDLVTRHGILRERLGDLLTDAFRAALLRRAGYRAEVLEFVDPQHTPRNTMLKAVRGAAGPDGSGPEYDALVAEWGVKPYLAGLLGDAGR